MRSKHFFKFKDFLIRIQIVIRKYLNPFLKILTDHKRVLTKMKFSQDQGKEGINLDQNTNKQLTFFLKKSYIQILALQLFKMYHLA